MARPITLTDEQKERYDRLIASLKSENFDEVDLLLEKFEEDNIDVLEAKLRDSSKNLLPNPMSEAVGLMMPEPYEYLKAKGAELKVEHGVVGVHAAIAHADLSMLERLIEEFPPEEQKEVINAQSSSPKDPYLPCLQFTLTDDELDDETKDAIIHFLVEHGADVNIESDSYHMYPLHEAADRGYLALVKFLLDQGARIYCPTYARPVHETVVDIAKRQMHIAQVQNDDEMKAQYEKLLKTVEPKMTKAIGTKGPEVLQFIAANGSPRSMEYWAEKYKEDINTEWFYEPAGEAVPPLAVALMCSRPRNAVALLAAGAKKSLIKGGGKKVLKMSKKCVHNAAHNIYARYQGNKRGTAADQKVSEEDLEKQLEEAVQWTLEHPEEARDKAHKARFFKLIKARTPTQITKAAKSFCEQGSSKRKKPKQESDKKKN